MYINNWKRMNTPAVPTSDRDVILRSWDNTEDSAIIKNVATKGKYINMCIEYLSKRRKCTLEEGHKYFQSIVELYVSDLLREKRISKAENILGNVGRKYKYFYYQFAFETSDDGVKEAILNHMEKKNAEHYQEEVDEMLIYWKVLQNIEQNPSEFKEEKENLGELTLENLFTEPEMYRKSLLVKAYFISKTEEYIEKLEKLLVWDYIVKVNIYIELISWTNIFYKRTKNVELELEYDSPLQEQYFSWDIDNDMFQKALISITSPPDAVRNSFAANGYIFNDEKENVQIILRRLFTTESIEVNISLIESLPVEKVLFELKHFAILLEDFVRKEKVENLKNSIENVRKEDIDIILSLKSIENSLESLENLLSTSKLISTYLHNINNDFYKKKPIVFLTELLLDGSSDMQQQLQDTNNCNILEKIPYMKSLLQRMDKIEEAYPITVAHLLKKFKEIDLDSILTESGDEPITFSNVNLSKKYSRNIKYNFLYYLKQERSAYAVYSLLMEQLMGYSQISVPQLYNAAQIAMELCISKFQDNNLVSHCVAFIEMLGFDSKNLRCYVALLKFNQQKNSIQLNPINYNELILNTEQKIIIMQKYPDVFPLGKYNVIMKILKCFPINDEPLMIMRKFAEENKYWELLVFFQYFDIPLKQIKNITKYFKSIEIGENFVRALLYNATLEKTKRRTSKTKIRSRPESLQTTESTETNTINTTKFIQHSKDLDIFGIILLSTSNLPEEKISSFAKFIEMMHDSHNYSASVNLMKNSIKYNLPVLAILATIISDWNVKWCWILWVLGKIDHLQQSFASFTENFVTFAFNMIEFCVKEGYIRILHNSFQIFYKDCKFNYFTSFLLQTMNLDFGPKSIEYLRHYLVALSNNEVQFPFIPESELNIEDLTAFTVKLQILHLQHNFKSSFHQKLLLDVICQSEMGDITGSIDFCLLQNVFEIVMSTEIEINFTNIPEIDRETHREYKNVCNRLQELKYFEKAIELAKLLNMPSDAIIYEKWIHNVEINNGDCDMFDYEKEAEIHSTQPDLLIGFYLHIANNMGYDEDRKYLIFKRVLEIIKKNHLFPNENFDRDRIEYEMVLCYIQGTKTIENFEVYHSEYYEQILLHERCVIYKTFVELKELAGVEDLNITNKLELSEEQKDKLGILLHKLLDDGDIVEALRLQAIFDYRPLDLRFLVFSMALAENLTNINNLSTSDRNTLSEVVKTSISKFKKRTLHRTTSASNSSSPTKCTDSSDTNSTLEFEEIPSREKQDVLEALQGLASRLIHGENIGKRILMTYRAAMYLDKDYVDVLKTKESLVLLKSAIEDDCLEKLVVVNDIFTSHQMSQIEIADFLAAEIATAVIRPRFYIFQIDQPNNDSQLLLSNKLWGYELEKKFHLFLDLSNNTTLLGNTLLDYCDALKTYRKYQDNKNYEEDIEKNPQLLNAFDSLRQIIKEYGNPIPRRGTNQVLSHKKQNTITVELLITAHRCFIHECSMEGIANILTRAKTLNSILTTAKSWNLIVRLLTGIGRYREMYYCFDTLMKNEQFESLLGPSDEEKSTGFRQAVITYLRENSFENTEYLRMACLSFSMHKELAAMWESEANQLIEKVLKERLEQKPSQQPSTSKIIEDNQISCTTEMLGQLNQIMGNFVNATENYILDHKLRLAQKNASMAELIAMQIDLVNKGLKNIPQTCICVLNVRSEQTFKDLVNKDLSVPQAMILERACSYEINWIDAILQQYILQGKDHYITDYCHRKELTDLMIENLAKSFQMQSNITSKMDENMFKLVEMVQSITVKYKLASVFGFKRIVTDMINDDNSIYFLKDTNYGRNENFLGST